MKYYAVLYGKNHEKHHTKTYIYKSAQDYSVGITVCVPANGQRKIALVHSVYETIPSALGIPEERISSIIGANDNVICREMITDYILALIDEYKDGVLPKETVVMIIDTFMKCSTLQYESNSNLAKVLNEIFPKICMVLDGKLAEYEFWKLLKDCEYLLLCGYTFEESRQDMHYAEDSLERTDDYFKVELELERLIIAEIGEETHMGYCHRYWSAKKRILKERYNMDWKSPVDLNPYINFD